MMGGIWEKGTQGVLVVYCCKLPQNKINGLKKQSFMFVYYLQVIFYFYFVYLTSYFTLRCLLICLFIFKCNSGLLYTAFLELLIFCSYVMFAYLGQQDCMWAI